MFLEVLLLWLPKSLGRRIHNPRFIRTQATGIGQPEIDTEKNGPKRFLGVLVRINFLENFPAPDGGPYTARWMQGRFKRFFAHANRDIPREFLPPVRVYDLRHRFATAVLNTDL